MAGFPWFHLEVQMFGHLSQPLEAQGMARSVQRRTRVELCSVQHWRGSASQWG